MRVITAHGDIRRPRSFTIFRPTKRTPFGIAPRAYPTHSWTYADRKPLRPFNVFPYCFESRLSQSSLRFVNENDYFILHTMDSQSNRLICVLGPFRFLVRLFSLSFFFFCFSFILHLSRHFSLALPSAATVFYRCASYNL